MFSQTRFSIFCVLIFSSLTLAAEAGRFHQAPPSSAHLKNPFQNGDKKIIQSGAKLFLKNCASCHGQDAMGTGNVPGLASGPAQSASAGELFWFVTHGSPENGMPPSQLSEKDRWRVVTFIKSLKGKAFQSSQKKTETVTHEDFPEPAAPFTDYRFEKPGESHKILPKDLPPPAPRTSVGNGPKIVARPSGAWPQAPKGFMVQLFAHGLDGPRLLRTAPNGDIFLAESRAGRIRVFRGVGEDGKAKSSEVFATELNEPYGLAFYPPGPQPEWIYVGDTNAVVRFPYHSGDLHATGPGKTIVELPVSEGGHWTRDLQFSLDGKKLFVGVGSKSNIDEPDTTPEEKNRADILVMTPEGKDIKVYASGIRNAGGGLAVQPKTGVLWCSVNERDGLGDNLVADYITHVVEGGFYGWPWWYIGGHQDPRHKGKHPELKEKLIEPDVLIQAHNASLQLTFYEGTQFPAQYRGDIFSSQHGSWNRSVRTGYEVIRVPLHGNGKATGEYEDFLTGFVVDNDRVWGRPVGVTVAEDGALLVSDDASGSIWRVVYIEK